MSFPEERLKNGSSKAAAAAVELTTKYFTTAAKERGKLCVMEIDNANLRNCCEKRKRLCNPSDTFIHLLIFWASFVSSSFVLIAPYALCILN